MSRQDELNKWLELPESFRNEVVTYLKKELDDSYINELKEAFEADKEGWWAHNGWHFYGGMAIRNLLREGGFHDDKLGPDGNWDDYYIQALETATGVA